MAQVKQILTGGKIYFDGYDLTSGTSGFLLKIKKPVKTVTCYDAAGVERINLLMDTEWTHNGFGLGGETNINGVDYAGLGETKILSVCPPGGAVGNDVFFTKLVKSVYQDGGSVGDVYPFAGAGLGNAEPCVHGKILATGEKTTTAAGAGIQLGAVSATQKIYGVLHCTATDAGGGESVTVKIQSCATEGGTYTDRITFTAITGTVTAIWGTPVPGEITDTWWKATWAITGSVTATIHVMAGIL